MSKPAFGTILDPELQPVRDAIHVPIIPVYAGSFLIAGEHIIIEKHNDKFVALPSVAVKSVGVVDPFLAENLSKGDMFYCFVKPESCKKLWHEWTHYKIDKL